MPTVAILGASADRSKYGNKSVRAHRKQGYDVYPVNPKGGEIDGLPVYQRLADVPVEPEEEIKADTRPVMFDAKAFAKTIAEADESVVSEVEESLKAETEAPESRVSAADLQKARWETLRTEGLAAMTQRLLQGWSM